jgi:hypothetical protein
VTFSVISHKKWFSQPARRQTPLAAPEYGMYYNDTLAGATVYRDEPQK